MVNVIKDLPKTVEDYEEKYEEIGAGAVLSQASAVLANAVWSWLI